MSPRGHRNEWVPRPDSLSAPPLIMKTILASLAAVAFLLSAHTASAQNCGSTPDSCLVVHTAAGCSDSRCCSTVCALAPDCCSITWDTLCAQLADSSCAGLCGASASGSCNSVHANGGCSDATCCSAVCANDPPCCDTGWDTTCVYETEFYCASGPPVQCGLPSQGSCTSLHATPGCNDGSCCTTVCALDPTCCTGAWDQFCVDLALSYCGGCTVTCPSNANTEPEQCGARSNDPCAGAAQAATPLSAGVGACGRLDGQNVGSAWAGDRDVYSITLTDTNADGLVRIVVHLQSDAPTFASLVPASCPVNLSTALLKVNSPNCVDSAGGICVPPGNYWVVVMPGTAASPGSATPITCDPALQYVLMAEVSQSGCAPACSTNTGPCFDIHQTPGCSTVACCQQTCLVDPTCCTVTWDLNCARTAATACGAPLPTNDTCANATPLAVGQTIDFSTIRATTDTLPLPASCDPGSGTAIGADLWYSYDSERRGNIVVSTCGSTTDLRLAVYSGTCASPTLVACGSNSILCSPSTGARVQFTAVCGTKYLIRVGGENPQQAGSGRITLTGSGPICPDHCPSDINRDHVVTGADLGLLLGNWRGYGLGDLNVDGTVNGADLGILLGDWGQCP